MDEEGPQIAMLLVPDLEPAEQAAENCAEEAEHADDSVAHQGLHVLGEKLVLESPGVIPVRHQDEEQQHSQAHQRHFEILPHFLSNECFHGCASGSEKINDFSPRSPK